VTSFVRHRLLLTLSTRVRGRRVLRSLPVVGVPNSSHDLRHTCATLLLTQGTHPKFAQELLGHATIAIALDTYSHVMPSMGDRTARAMKAALSPVEDAIT
jgi:integrase